MMIEGVELNIYYTNGENESIPLSEIQTTIVMKILGLEKQVTSSPTYRSGGFQ